jgi:hypothetical protein
MISSLTINQSYNAMAGTWSNSGVSLGNNRKYDVWGKVRGPNAVCHCLAKRIVGHIQKLVDNPNSFSHGRWLTEITAFSKEFFKHAQR